MDRKSKAFACRSGIHITATSTQLAFAFCWNKRYNQHGRKLIALIPSHQAKGNAISRMTSSEELLYEQAVHGYLSNKKPSIKTAYGEYLDSVEIENKSSETLLKLYRIEHFITE